MSRDGSLEFSENEDQNKKRTKKIISKSVICHKYIVYKHIVYISETY